MSNNVYYVDKTIGEIVAADFRAAEIFKKAGIEFGLAFGWSFTKK